MNTLNKDLLDFESYLIVQCHLSKLTVNAYLSDVQHFKDYFGNKIPSESAVVQFLKKLSRLEYTKSSVARKSSALKMYFNYCRQEKNMTVPDISELFHSNLTLKLPKLVSKNTMEMCLNYAFPTSKTPLRDQCIIAFLYFVGCRVSEIVSLSINNLLTDQVIIRGKGNKERMVPLSVTVIDKLRLYLDNERCHQESQWVFCNSKGNAFVRQTVTRIINQMKCDLNIKEQLSPHTFRHMFATTLMEKGMDLREVQLLLGHVSIVTTEIYTHLNKSRLRDVFNDCHSLS